MALISCQFVLASPPFAVLLPHSLSSSRAAQAPNAAGRRGWSEGKQQEVQSQMHLIASSFLPPPSLSIPIPLALTSLVNFCRSSAYFQCEINVIFSRA